MITLPADTGDRAVGGPELLPCPFCGNAKNIGVTNQKHDLSGGFYIACPECDASTGLRFACGEDPRPLLIEQWNRRSTSAALPLPMPDLPCPYTAQVMCGEDTSLYTAEQMRAYAQAALAQPARPEAERSDTARLDWMDAQWTDGIHVEVCAKGDGTTWHALRRESSVWARKAETTGRTVREAIDAAIALQGDRK